VDAPEEPVAVTCLPLFKNHHTLRKGRQKLLLYQATTPSLSANGKQAKRDEMYRIEKLIKQHESGEIPRVDWLDAMVFRQLQKIHQSESEASTDAFLYIELQKFDFVVVHTERSFMDTKASAVDSTLVHDGDLDADNLIEIKHRRLVRSHRNGPHDKELKPNAAIRDEINMILHYPPLQELTSEEKNLLWKFRYYLTRYKKALTKFLKSVSWEDPTEVAQAVGLLHEWEQVDMDDALELLKSEFRDIHVREYAIKQLERANDSVHLQLWTDVGRNCCCICCNWCKHYGSKVLLTRPVNASRWTRRSLSST
jgi:phosphatidylinositol 3-kinase